MSDPVGNPNYAPAITTPHNTFRLSAMKALAFGIPCVPVTARSILRQSLERADPLEDQLQAQLELPCASLRRSHHTEVASTEVLYWDSEVRVVKCVERLGAEL